MLRRRGGQPYRVNASEDIKNGEAVKNIVDGLSVKVFHKNRRLNSSVKLVAPRIAEISEIFRHSKTQKIGLQRIKKVVSTFVATKSEFSRANLQFLGGSNWISVYFARLCREIYIRIILSVLVGKQNKKFWAQRIYRPHFTNETAEKKKWKFYHFYGAQKNNTETFWKCYKVS